MKLRNRTIPLLTALLAFGASRALAGAACDDASVKAACQPNPKAAACAELQLACGFSELVLGNLGSVEPKTPAQHYFMGAAYHDLFVRSRAKALQCEYLYAARAELGSFLDSAQETYTKESTFGTAAEMRNVYHASKILEETKRVPGCVESGIPLRDLPALGRRYAEERLDTLFLNDEGTDALTRHAVEEIAKVRSTAQDVISKASAIETGIGLREEETALVSSHLDRVAETTFTEAELTKARTFVTGLKTTVDQRAADLKKALEFTPEEYEGERRKAVAEARKTVVGLDATALLLQDTFPATDRAKPFWRLRELTTTAGPASLGGALATIAKQWKAKPLCSTANAAAYWYCQKETP